MGTVGFEPVISASERLKSYALDRAATGIDPSHPVTDWNLLLGTLFSITLLVSWDTYLLTPRCRVLLEKLTGLQLVKKFPAFHGTWRFITALTSVRHKQASRMWVFLNKGFYREGLLAPRPTPKLKDRPSSAVRDCLFNIFAATLPIGGRSSIRNLRTRHAVVTGTHYMEVETQIYNKYFSTNCSVTAYFNLFDFW